MRPCTVRTAGNFPFGTRESALAAIADGSVATMPLATARAKTSEMRWRTRCAVSTAPRASIGRSTSRTSGVVMSAIGSEPIRRKTSCSRLRMISAA